MKGLLATLITVSGAILMSTSVTAQETNSLSSSEILRPIQGQECSEYLSSCLPNIGGEKPGSLEERVKYTQEEINYLINGEGRGHKPEGSTLQLTPGQRAEIENSSSPNGLVFSRFRLFL